MTHIRKKTYHFRKQWMKISTKLAHYPTKTRRAKNPRNSQKTKTITRYCSWAFWDDVSVTSSEDPQALTTKPPVKVVMAIIQTRSGGATEKSTFQSWLVSVCELNGQSGSRRCHVFNWRSVVLSAVSLSLWLLKNFIIEMSDKDVEMWFRMETKLYSVVFYW